MIDIDEPLYRILMELPEVDHVSISQEGEQIYIIIRANDGTKYPITMGLRELLVNALSNTKFFSTETLELDKEQE